MLQPCGADIIMLKCLQAGYFRHLQTFSDIISVIVKKQNNNVADLCVLPSARSINARFVPFVIDASDQRACYLYNV